jgi:hypothetical protein
MTTVKPAVLAGAASTPSLPRREVTGAWLMLSGLTVFSLGGLWDLQGTSASAPTPSSPRPT